jgi:hypothetical protein
MQKKLILCLKQSLPKGRALRPWLLKGKATLAMIKGHFSYAMITFSLQKFDAELPILCPIDCQHV